MPAPVSPAEFLDLVQKSGVVEPPRLAAFAAAVADAPDQAGQSAQSVAAWMVRDGLLSRFQAELLAQGRYKRFFIGKYKVLERLGRGGMANVFLCEHTLMRRRVALKVLPAAKSNDPAARDRFVREARAAAALDHPNIVRAYDIDSDGGLHFLVMEYIDGTNLFDLVRKVGPLDPVRAAHYIAGAAVGLQHAHAMGLVHRDIKPGNILIDRAGVVKVLDLGLALFSTGTEDDQITRKYDETVLGTADYLAPEQALDSHTVDGRADVYSLGATFYYLLTGTPPFPTGTIAQKLLWHQTTQPQPIADQRPDVPAEVVAVIDRMMAKNPADRYPTPTAVATALAPWTQSPIAPPADAELPSEVRAGVPGAPLASRTLAGPGTMTSTADSAPADPVFVPTPEVKPGTDVWSTVAAGPASERIPTRWSRRLVTLLAAAGIAAGVLAAGAAVYFGSGGKPAAGRR